ncbi:hypothetical protein BC938DRAFT_479078 [Jimgerdemannia flammicorona]|uniref:BZIP domain-containing protein n=1 Tax=Jimgerdemannia flammicorona TaxID=994334 RepID=A0A433QYC5_9FUNG|nr:hypothetical protein BC938DRAFT_479078 [Jimgerdemannia flammicorona]
MKYNHTTTPALKEPISFINEDPAAHVRPLPPLFDPDDPSVRIKRKPGRKPNPVAPMLRKAANRVAQRAFRERKEHHIKELEEQVKALRDRAGKESDELRATVEAYRVENGYLRNLVVLMQSVLIQHGIPAPEFGDMDVEVDKSTRAVAPNGAGEGEVPMQVGGMETLTSEHGFPLERSPARTLDGSEQELQFHFEDSSAQQVPGSISVPVGLEFQPDTMIAEAAVPVQAQYFSRSSTDTMYIKHSDPSTSPLLPWGAVTSTPLNTSQPLNPDFGTILQPITPGAQLIDKLFAPEGISTASLDHIMEPLYAADTSYVISSDPIHDSPSPASLPTSPESTTSTYSSYSSYQLLTPSASATSTLPTTITINADTPIVRPPPELTTRAAIQLIELQLRAQSVSKTSNLPYSIHPTALQHAVPHDPRIDLLPSMHIRDRMIVFRESFDLEACIHMLMTKAKFHGGNPADPENWELPEEFFTEFWFCCVHSDVVRTNKWRRARGAPDVRWKTPPVEELKRFGAYGEARKDPAIGELYGWYRFDLSGVVQIWVSGMFFYLIGKYTLFDYSIYRSYATRIDECALLVMTVHGGSFMSCPPYYLWRSGHDACRSLLDGVMTRRVGDALGASNLRLDRSVGSLR